MLARLACLLGWHAWNIDYYNGGLYCGLCPKRRST